MDLARVHVPESLSLEFLIIRTSLLCAPKPLLAVIWQVTYVCPLGEHLLVMRKEVLQLLGRIIFLSENQQIGTFINSSVLRVDG